MEGGAPARGSPLGGVPQHSRIQPDLLEGHELPRLRVLGLIHHPIGALSDLLYLLEYIHVQRAACKTDSAWGTRPHRQGPGCTLRPPWNTPRHTSGPGFLGPEASGPQGSPALPARTPGLRHSSCPGPHHTPSLETGLRAGWPLAQPRREPSAPCPVPSQEGAGLRSAGGPKLFSRRSPCLCPARPRFWG